jgi:hypothetical protein
LARSIISVKDSTGRGSGVLTGVGGSVGCGVAALDGGGAAGVTGGGSDETTGLEVQAATRSNAVATAA